MKKFLVFCVGLMCLMSCGKDYPDAKDIYQNSTVIENVNYETRIYAEGDEYRWTNVNQTDEVTYRYTFNYERKTDLAKDFAELAAGVEAFDEELVPAFTQVFRFGNDVDHNVLVFREVEQGQVFVKFVVGEKVFRLPYAFVVGANAVLNPDKK